MTAVPNRIYQRRTTALAAAVTAAPALPPFSAVAANARGKTKHSFVIAVAAVGTVAAAIVGCSKASSPTTNSSAPASAPPKAEMTWQTDDVTALAGAPPAAFVLPGSYVSEGQRTQHLIYLGFTDNHLHELWSDATGWHTDDLTAATGASEPLPNRLVGYTFEAQNTQHVIYVGASDAHVHELWSDTTGWHTDDLTAATGAPPAGSVFAAFAFEAQRTQHVFYLDDVDYKTVNLHIHELWADATGWHTSDLTAATGAPPPTGSPVGYAFEAQGTLHVIYTAGGRGYELWWDRSGWHTDDLGVTAGVFILAGYVSEGQGTQHVIYTAGGHLYELWWDTNGRHTEDLTAATGAKAAGGEFVGYAFEAQGTQHVFYVGRNPDDQHVHEVWSDATGWHTDDLSTATGAPSVQGGTPNGVGLTGYVFAAQGTQHVFYVSYLDNHIHELWWGPRAVAQQPGTTTATTSASTAPAGPAVAGARFVGQWRVHGASLDITPTTATIKATSGTGCNTLGPQAVCGETDTLAVVSGDNTQLTLRVTAVSYNLNNGQKTSTNPEGPSTAAGDLLQLVWQAPGLLKETVLHGFPEYEGGGNPYWCGTGISRANSELCGA